MDIIGSYILNGKTDNTEHFKIISVTLYEFSEMCFFFMLIILFVSWWMVPCRIILKPFLDKAEKITFECKKEK